ncbi:hypothetical protein Celgi_1534 [Cellulomonas gilvus ATCC 13127]|uniref:Uncharacterized protein n=1 Tax=Cellulomonas gilvus (strain ATCC 13127 / NRRL B-14078) TaxID=593907 RepID=F8A4E6_CELGA|nr:hypothetical protein Celgi_1534 [Cellulomonas gilvus ATCC 13127]
MRKPETTKKTSTPTYPPGSAAGQTWKTTTAATASARSTWMSRRVPSAAGRGPAAAPACGRSRVLRGSCAVVVMGSSRLGGAAGRGRTRVDGGRSA